MTGVTLAALLGVTMASPADSYRDAYQAMQQSGRPIVVLVGAGWCPACRTMKSEVIPALENHGTLNHVEFAYVDTDQQRPLARRLMQGGSIPQLVMYHKTESGWKLGRIVGARSAETVAAFIDRGVVESQVADGPSQPGGAPAGD